MTNYWTDGPTCSGIEALWHTRNKMHSELIDNNAFHGVFQVKMKDAFDPVKRDHSVNTYSRISTLPPGSEGSE